MTAASTANSTGHSSNTSTADTGPADKLIKRRIVEFCCGGDSLIGQLAPPDCEVIRLTIDDDMTSEAGLAKALRAVTDTDLPVMLFGALPCTGGSPYQNINWHRSPKTRGKIRAHWAIFRALWINFHKVATSCLSRGGQVALE